MAQVILPFPHYKEFLRKRVKAGFGPFFKLSFIVAFPAFFIFLSCSKDEITDKTVVAQIDDHPISVRDFRVDYELALAKPRPVRPSTAGNDKKSEHLQSMLEEKLLSLAALDLKMAEDVNVRRLLKWYEKQAVIRELYKTEIADRIEVDEAETREAFLLLNEKVEVRQILVPTKAVADALYQRFQHGESFEQVAMDLAKSDEELKKLLTPGEFTWGQLDENLETALFGLNLNEISAPVKAGKAYHIVQLLNRKTNLLLTEYDYQERQHYVETIIRRRKEAVLAKKYATSLMESLRPRAVGAVLLALTEMAGKVLRSERTEHKIPTRLQAYEVRPHLGEILNKELVVFNGGSWTVGQFLDLVEQSPPNSRPDLTKPGDLKVHLSAMIRDEFLADRGYQRHLQKSAAVVEEVSRVRDEVLASRLRTALWDTVRVSKSELRDYFARNSNRYEIPDMVEVQEIMVRDAGVADSLYNALMNGSDMAELARAFSVRKWAAKKDGILGYISEDSFGEIGKKSVQMAVGELSSPVPVKVEGITVGYSIFKVIGRKAGRKPPLSEISSRVSTDALYSKRVAVLDKFLAGVKEHYPVRIDESVLQSIKTIADLTGPGRPIDILKVTHP